MAHPGRIKNSHGTRPHFNLRTAGITCRRTAARGSFSHPLSRTTVRNQPAAMTLTILSDEQVNAILESLTVDELDEFRRDLSEALHEFSTSVKVPEEAFQQPPRSTTLHPETQVKTSYMAACGPTGMGCKGECFGR